MAKQTDMVRRRAVWDEKARNPHLTSAEIAERLGMSDRTVRADIVAAERATNEAAATSVRAAIFERNAQIIAAHMPLALSGKTRNAEVVFTAHKELRDLFGLDSPRKFDIRHIVEQTAEEFGLTEHERERLLSDVEAYMRDTEVSA